MLFLSCILLISGIFFGDLWIKNQIEYKMNPTETDRPAAKETASPQPFPASLWKDRILLHRYHNKGAMLNLGQRRSGAVTLLSAVLCLLLSVCFLFSLGQRGNAGLRLGLSLLLGGSFSNTYDRLKRKYVVDYVSFNVPCKAIRRIVFNISDFFIIIGAVITVLWVR